MKNKYNKILSAGAITAFSLSLAVGLSAQVDQTTQQQGAPLQGNHPGQYGTPGERDPGDPGHTPGEAAVVGEQEQEYGQRSREREFQQQRATQQEIRTDQSQQEVRTSESREDEKTLALSDRGQGKTLKATDLMEKQVENQDGEKLGTVEDLIVDVDSGELEFVVVSSGGILGIGGDLRAVPPGELSEQGEDRLVLDISSDRWEEAPTIERDEIARLGEEQQSEEIRSFYQQDSESIQFGSPEQRSSAQDQQKNEQELHIQEQQEQQEFGAREEQQIETEQTEQREWGDANRTESSAELEASEQARERSSHTPSQQWQERHRTAEPNRLPGDPQGAPAAPRALTPDRHGVQSDLQDQTSVEQNVELQEDVEIQQQEQQEFAGRQQETTVSEQDSYAAVERDAPDSAATEWRARAFEEDLQRAEQNREMQFGSPQQRTRAHREARVEGETRGAPALNNPRLHSSHRGTERERQEFALGSRQQADVEQSSTGESRVYGQPTYRKEQRNVQRSRQEETRQPQTEWQQRQKSERQRSTQMQDQRRGSRQDRMDQTASRGEANLKMASDLIGENVQDQSQEEIGEISDLLVDLQSGRVQHTIVTLDERDDRYAVPLRQLQVDEQGRRITLQSDRQRLERAPRYEQQSSGQSEEIFRYEEQEERRRTFGARQRDEEQDQAVEEQEDSAEIEESATEEKSESREFGAREHRSIESESSQAGEAEEADPTAEAEEEKEGAEERK